MRGQQAVPDFPIFIAIEAAPPATVSCQPKAIVADLAALEPMAASKAAQDLALLAFRATPATIAATFASSDHSSTVGSDVHDR